MSVGSRPEKEAFYSSDEDFESEPELFPTPDPVAAPPPDTKYQSPEVSPSRASSKSSKPENPTEITPETHLRRAHRRIRLLLASEPALGQTPVDVTVLDDFIRCVPLARIVFGDFHWRVGRAHADLALAYLDVLALPTQAHDHALTAKSLLAQNVDLPEHHPREKAGILESFLVAYYALGRSCARLDKDVEAEKALLKCERIHGEFAKLTCVPDAVARDWEIKIVLAVARLSAKRKSYDTAEDEFRRCLDLIGKTGNGGEDEDAEGIDDDVALVPVLMDLARMKQSIGSSTQIEASIDIFLKAHTINVREHPEDHHLSTARSALAVGRAYAALDGEDARISGEAHMRKSVESLEVLLGCAHEETQAGLGYLAKLLIRMSKTPEAVEVLKKKIRGRFEAEGGEFSDAMAADHQLLGSLFLANGQLDRAHAHLKKCHAIQRVVLGPNHRKTKATLDTINSIPMQ